MMVSEEEEFPTRRNCTSYKLFSFCQEESKESLVNPSHAKFSSASYETFLNCLHKRFELVNLKLLPASKRLSSESVVVLKEQKTLWHTKCYQIVTHRSHIYPDKTNYQKPCTSGKVTYPTNRKRGRPSFCIASEVKSKLASSLTIKKSISSAKKTQTSNFMLFLLMREEIKSHRLPITVKTTTGKYSLVM